ncbi:glycosyl hydrolase family 18 protein [Pedobacter sp. MC2016-24]|uniref:glycosyl hydrolase family 18 protein n=1 Tax=Pedobacter sp. MC2016-24 TaxID=2780090 RepID=UPI001880A938|nr:glycosyl hydrolase family 18 protein [Pedobacter sp. MC2016-24]MBE9600493.1 chitinase [Pedobacter sp. MC2016-24]
MKKFLILSIVVAAAFASCTKEIAKVPDGYGAKEFVKPTTPYVADVSFKKVSYFPSYRFISDIDTTSLDDLTHVIFSFLKPRADGTLVLDDSKENVKTVMSLVKRHNCKMIIALNGDNKIYTTLLSNPQSKQLLIKNIVAYAVENQYDGVDMDWEYPSASKGSDVTFGLFMKDLSNELHSWHKTLSMAVTAGVYAGPVKDGINQDAIDACDFVNLMAYDGIGADAAAPADHSAYTFAEKVLDVWLTQKNLPKEKTVLGLPAYGKGREKPDAADKALPFKDLLKAGADPKGSQFVVSGITYYYNGIPLIEKKTALAKARGNGIMFWELSQDVAGASSLIKAANQALSK